jgi:hypothetical protein
MRLGRPRGRTLLILILVVIAASSVSLNAAGLASSLSVPLPSPAPGTYGAPVLVSFPCPAGKRIALSINGSPFEDLASPVLFAAEKGEEKEYRVEARLYSLAPGSIPESSQSFVWRIDRKSPLPPVLSASPREGGLAITATLTESGIVSFRMWHPFTKSSSQGSLSSGESLFLPDGATLVAFAEDEAGNRSDPVSPDPSLALASSVPFRVISPAPGSWANRQALVVEHSVGTEILYSVDGSDPALSGLAYDGPLLLDKSGLVTLRILAIDRNGKRFSSQCIYTVAEESIQPPAGFPEKTAMTGGNEFTEITIPDGFSWTFGDGIPSGSGGKTIAVSAVRGALRLYPIVLSDGSHRWRYIIENGAQPASSAPMASPAPTAIPATPESAPIDSRPTLPAPASTQAPAIMPAAASTVNEATPPTNSPVVRINDWYFVSFSYDSPLYWSLDGSSWHQYKAPVFVDRSRDAALFWYSSGWKNGEKQKITLPAKPVLLGIHAGDVTSSPVFLSAGKSPMKFRYTVGSAFYPKAPDESSAELGSGLLVEIPSGAEADFTVRVRAEYDGLVQGELVTNFAIDRKPPRNPATGLESRASWSRTPVQFSPRGEDSTEISITPPIFSRAGNDWVLDGVFGKAVDYTVTVFSVDRAGNRSDSATTRLTVELNTAYVGEAENASRDKATSGDGSPSAPFTSLDDALALAEQGSWRIIAHGSVPLARANRITGNVSIEGKGASVNASEAASISVEGGFLTITSIGLRKAGGAEEAGPVVMTGLPVAFLTVMNGSLRLRDMDVVMTAKGNACLLRATASRIDCVSSRFRLDAGDYAQLFDIADSSIGIDSSSLACSARNASTLVLTGTRAEIKASTLSVIPQGAARAIEAWASNLTLADVTLERKNPATGTDAEKNRDTAFWLDAKSRVLAETGVVSRGFWREREKGVR